MDPATLNDLESLFLEEIAEEPIARLRIRFRPGMRSGVKQDIQMLGHTIEDVEQVLPEATIEYELIFDHYVAYSVLNESYDAGMEKEPSRGKFHTLSDSHFLGYLGAVTCADERYPGPFLHYRICFENHIVNVAATAAPSLSGFGREGEEQPN